MKTLESCQESTLRLQGMDSEDRVSLTKGDRKVLMFGEAKSYLGHLQNHPK